MQGLARAASRYVGLRSVMTFLGPMYVSANISGICLLLYFFKSIIHYQVSACFYKKIDLFSFLVNSRFLWLIYFWVHDVFMFCYFNLLF